MEVKYQAHDGYRCSVCNRYTSTVRIEQVHGGSCFCGRCLADMAKAFKEGETRKRKA